MWVVGGWYALHGWLVCLRRSLFPVVCPPRLLQERCRHRVVGHQQGQMAIVQAPYCLCRHSSLVLLVLHLLSQNRSGMPAPPLYLYDPSLLEGHSNALWVVFSHCLCARYA
jgi:hypothetical protein